MRGSEPTSLQSGRGRLSPRAYNLDTCLWGAAIACNDFQADLPCHGHVQTPLLKVLHCAPWLAGMHQVWQARSASRCRSGSVQSAGVVAFCLLACCLLCLRASRLIARCYRDALPPAERACWAAGREPQRNCWVANPIPPGDLKIRKEMWQTQSLKGDFEWQVQNTMFSTTRKEIW